MMMLLKLLSWLRGLSSTVKLALLGAVLLSSLTVTARVVYHRQLAAAATDARNAEREAQRVVMTRYVARITPLLARKDSIEHHTDTLRLRVTSDAHTAHDAIAAIPTTVREAAAPSIINALDACEKLVPDVEAISRAILTERAAWQPILAADTAMIHAQASQIVALTDSTRMARAARDRKPGWGMVAKVGGALLGVGIMIGEFVLPWGHR